MNNNTLFPLRLRDFAYIRSAKKQQKIWKLSGKFVSLRRDVRPKVAKAIIQGTAQRSLRHTVLYLQAEEPVCVTGINTVLLLIRKFTMDLTIASKRFRYTTLACDAASWVTPGTPGT